MKRKKRYLCIAVAVMMLFLTGCGEEMHELTKEEEELIIQSAAYFVAKHNIQQKDGANGYPLPESFDEAESESGSEPESESESEDKDTPSGSGGIGTTKPTGETITLAELIGHKNELKVTFEGSYVSNTYMEGSAYSVDAQKGKTFYVMKFKMANITDKDIKVNNASKSPIMKLTSDGVTVKSEVTFLNSDFSTYQGTIKAGKSVETILLFEVSETLADKIKAPTLQATVGKTTKTIKL